MRKLALSAMVLVAGLWASAQLVEVESARRVELPEGVVAVVPTISPDGSFIVLSDAGSDALHRVDLADGTISLVTVNGQGNDVSISDDGTQIVFRQVTTDRNHLRRVALKAVETATGTERELVAPSRHLNTGVALAGTSVTAVENGRVKARNLAGGRAVQAPLVSINYGHLDYTVDGRTVTLDPQGRGSYLWPQLSPDGTKVVYYLAGRGCFVCNVDGSDVRALGMLRAAKWLDNEIVVGMNDVDDGHMVTSSSLIASNLDGVRQELTPTDIIAMYPSITADGKKIAYVSEAGEIFVLNLK